ncbi:unnamed protein product [Closterium sp. NIES-53]
MTALPTCSGRREKPPPRLPTALTSVPTIGPSFAKLAQAFYGAGVKSYSPPSSATLCHLVLPFLFPELSDFTTVADLMTHLHSPNSRYSTALKPEFMTENQPPMYLTLYFLAARLPDTLCAVRDLMPDGQKVESEIHGGLVLSQNVWLESSTVACVKGAQVSHGVGNGGEV